MKWISLKEKWPAEDENVLILVNSHWRDLGYVKEVYTAYWDEIAPVEDGGEPQKEWRFTPCNCSSPTFFEVLYWTPIPEQPI